MNRFRAALLAGAVLAAGVLTVVVQMTNAQAATQICDQYGSATGSRYVVQNNRWGTDVAQCITVNSAVDGFSLDTGNANNPTNGAPASYPSVYYGCHYGNCSPGTILPLPASDSRFRQITTSVSMTYPSGGAWDAAYDIWFDPAAKTTGQNNGVEIMVWLNHLGPIQPVGSKIATATVAGAAFDVWGGRIADNGGWNVVSYVRQAAATSMDFAVSAFFDDAVGRGYAQSGWYLTSVQAGFEPWTGGAGLTVQSFSVTTGATPTPTPTSEPPASGNLALNRPATSSSNESSSLGAALAVDGNTSTRWGSAYSDPQWIQVDLGASQQIKRVVLRWEAAYAKGYQVQTSADATNWTTVYTTSTGTGGVNDLAVTATGRYLRVYGTARANTSWGYSLYEIEAYSTGAPPPPPPGPVTRSTVLNWLAGLPNGSTNRVASGFFGGYSGGTFNLDQTEQLHNQTGQYPAVLACDYGNWVTSSNTQVNSSCNSTLKSWQQRGGLVSVGIHWPNPGSGGFGTKLPNFADITNPGTAVGSAWLNSLKQVGDGLADLKSAGVVVLWRPFHEMNGDWFWWGNQDPTTFKNVWNSMHNYLVNTRGLDNLVWVYAPDFSRGNATGYFAGGNVVDIVGMDAYDDNPAASGIQSTYNQLLGLGKPFAFTEIGPDNSPFDYGKWINAIKQYYPKTSYFLAWNDKWGPPQNQNSGALMNDPWTLNLGEVSISGGTTPPTSPPPTSPPAGQGACSAGYAVTDSWAGGFNAEVTVRNTGTTGIGTWTVTWTFANGQTITNSWNTTLTTAGAAVTAKPVSYNAAIAAGATTSFGFSANVGGTNTAPALTCTAG
ncbi:discoidin domain-containing protein [Dactylosporangium aurantiacum]|uniref:Discoidin domain-containing protein n=1 Tax=Dactylosporangium aurantiacum TaxID=35754 RepID=A0A9Q9INE9_9ACTN|nr:glycosyl hydrolase [Dactylosporangium aurantiacum]MDG6106303.1 glycosyl hydrolase [Dactylosporangium aurantiacum]UWZ58203.1 discoidin domain-containing protein [Dactylosporangium aurantiacum]